MARIRTVKPDAWQDRRLGQRTRDARLLWVVLLTMCDDEGRFRALPLGIAGHGYAHDLKALQAIPGWLEELAAAGLIVLYDVDAEPFGCFPRWANHQRVNKPTPSRIPAPPELPQETPGNPESPQIPPPRVRGRVRAPEVEEEGEKEEEKEPAPRASAPAAGQAGSTPLVTIWGQHVRPLIEQIPEWDAWMSRGGDAAVYSVMQGRPDFPWQQIAAHAVSQKQAGSITTNDPCVALRMKADDHEKRTARPGAITDPGTAARAADYSRVVAANQDRLAATPAPEPDWVDEKL
jgi:hypothetical protein